MPKPATVLADFQRTMRDEPLYYIYKHRIYVEKNEVSAEEVHAWLVMRYVKAQRGNRYRVVTYKHQNGERYVDYILMETCRDKDLIEMKMRWGWTEHKVSRESRVPRLKLSKEQRVIRDAIVKRALEDFYATLS